MHSASVNVCEEIVIKGYRPNFLHDVLRIEEECFKPELRYSPSLFNYYYERGSIFRVAECNGLIVGYVIADVEDSYCHVVSIAVKPARRGKGIGSRLLDHALTECRRLGAKKAYLEVSAFNESALRLYLKAGFRVVGVIRGYYGNEDAYVMIRDLAQNGV